MNCTVLLLASPTKLNACLNTDGLFIRRDSFLVELHFAILFIYESYDLNYKYDLKTMYFSNYLVAYT